ncbi:MAG: peptide chain release factor 1 [Hyphomicrobiaceae bacterium]|nr:peptide chain release factor 1 [Hyphomicrobiaceae bacterium]
MSSLPKEKLASLIERWELVQQEMNTNTDPNAFGRLSKEFSNLDPIIRTIHKLGVAQQEVLDLKSMLTGDESDVEVIALAKQELSDFEQKVENLEQQLKLQLLPKDEADDRSVILEVRAGTGGDEATLFAADLFRMYARYAELKKWRVEIMEYSVNDVGGYKEVIASITGYGVFARLKFESGVHRVQRVPATETSGRIHTSAATVAVLPKADEVDIEIRQEDLRIDTMRASGAGGQHVNTTDSAVRIIHVPTGITVVSAEKSQHQNRRNAMQVLRSRLYDMERERIANDRAETRRGQVGSGDRSQRIRTYNFPQGRVTDHRINLTLHKLDEMLSGHVVDQVVDALVTNHQATQLAAFESDD